MDTQNNSLPLSDSVPERSDTNIATVMPLTDAAYTPTGNGHKPTWLPSFWQERFFEIGLILSMVLYYVVGNQNLHILYIEHFSLLLNEYISLPFLIVFLILCWYRLPSAIALLPLSLPFYMQQKVVLESFAFSLAEVTLVACLGVAIARLLVRKQERFFWLQLRERVGPFILPIVIFGAVAALSIYGAFSQRHAIRAYHEEVLAPLFYLVLALVYLRTRTELARLLIALLGTGFLVACFGLVQYFFFKGALVVGDGRVYAMYGSANSIGLLFNYVMPLGIAWALARVARRERLLALGVCMVMLPVLYLTNSAGAWAAMAVAFVFIGALSLRNRRLLLIGSVIAVVVVVLMLLVFHARIYTDIIDWHARVGGQSSLTKRFYLWQSAWNMIKDSPWLGYGMDNWLCHYSKNGFCMGNGNYYMIKIDPITHQITGLGNEPTLSHPHNIFLHIWVSMGIFGVVAYSAVLVLFCWLFVRILRHLGQKKVVGYEQLRWMTVGIGGGMVAALVQGMVDSAFLEQDLAFCFWMLVAALLLLRIQAGVAWRRARLEPESTKH